MRKSGSASGRVFIFGGRKRAEVPPSLVWIFGLRKVTKTLELPFSLSLPAPAPVGEPSRELVRKQEQTLFNDLRRDRIYCIYHKIFSVFEVGCQGPVYPTLKKSMVQLNEYPSRWDIWSNPLPQPEQQLSLFFDLTVSPQVKMKDPQELPKRGKRGDFDVLRCRE